MKAVTASAWFVRRSPFVRLATALTVTINLFVICPVNAQDAAVSISAAEFQRMVYAAHLHTQLAERPELDASLQVMLTLQQRNPDASPAALVDLCRQTLLHYRNKTPANLITLGDRDQILAEYLGTLQQLPARTNFVPANLSLLHNLTARAQPPTDEPQADLIHSGSQQLLSGEIDTSERHNLLEACTRRAQRRVAFAGAMDGLFLPETPFSVSSTPAEIIGSTNSPLHESPTMQTLLALSDASTDGSLTVSSNELMSLFNAETEILWDTIDNNLELAIEINQSQPDLMAYLTNHAAMDVNVQRTTELKRGQSDQIASATVAILVQSELMEADPTLFDITLPGQFEGIGSAMSSIASGLNIITHKEAAGFTKAMAGGNFLTAGVQIFNLINGTESPDDRVAREIGNIQTLIEDLSVNINYRFDRVDQSLTTIFNTLNEQFDKIIIIDGKIEELQGDVDQIRMSLLDVHTELNRIERNLATFHALDWRFDLLEDMNLALGYESRVGNPMQYQDFVPSYVGMENIFYTHAYNRAASETLSRYTTLPFDNSKDLYFQLSSGGATNVYSEILNYIKKCLREPSPGLGLSGFSPDPLLVNPQDWNAGAGAWLQLALENPGYFRDYERTIGHPSRLDGIIRKGRDLTNFYGSLTFTGTNINWPLCSALESHYVQKLTNFNARIQATEQDFANDHQFALSTWRQWDSAAPRVVTDNTELVGSPSIPSLRSGEPLDRIAAGYEFSLALKSDGTIIGWGDNSEGQTSPPADLTNAIEIAAGYSHSLALKSDGTIIGWGNNRRGQTNVPSDLTNVVAIAAGDVHSLALRADGTVVAWGSNHSGQTNVPAKLTNAVAIASYAWHSLALKADGTVAAWGDDDDNKTRVPAGLTNAVAVAAGGHHSLALKDNGTVVGWGANHYGQISIPPGLTNVVAIAAAGNFSMAMLSDATVLAWGMSSIFGDPTAIPAGLTNVVSIAAGNFFGLALQADNTLVAWGGNGWGQTTIPTHFTNLVEITAGYSDSLALKADGSVVGWGRDWYGQTSIPDGLTNVDTIAAGYEHSLALTTDGTVVAWGMNDFGQTNIPSGVVDVMAIAPGGYHNLVLTAEGSVVTWGYNNRGQTTVPSNLSDVVAITAGGEHSLALKADGTVVAWGNNESGQSSVPVGLANVVAIAAGWGHSLALKTDGTVVAWGNNQSGQTNNPASLTNVVSIAAGFEHSLALQSDGTAVAWGNNESGQTNVTAGLTNVVAIAAGYSHSLFLTAADSGGATDAEALSLVTARIPDRVRNLFQDCNQNSIDELGLVGHLNNAAKDLSGAKALLAAVMELGMPYTLERDDILRGFLYGNESLVDLNAAPVFLEEENAKLQTSPHALPQTLADVGAFRFLRFQERLHESLNDLQATGQPELPRLVVHTLHLLNLLRDSWSTVPPPALEIGTENQSLRLLLYGEPYLRYTMEYRNDLYAPGWHSTGVTNLLNEESLTPTVSGPSRFYRAKPTTP